jgi:hypothetical protein
MSRSLLVWVALYCLCFAGARSQPLGAAIPLEVATTQRAGGELNQNRHWTYLYAKLAAKAPFLHYVIVTFK